MSGAIYRSVTRLNGKSPAAVLAEVTTDWREENTPVVMAGMVGSNVGWKVAPGGRYFAEPVETALLAGFSSPLDIARIIDGI